MTEKWALNASPLILLGKARQLHWVPQLGTVIVPASVSREICEGRPEDPARRWIEQEIGRSLIVPDVEASTDLIGWDLGSGETAVIAWCQADGTFEAVLDDAAARRCARIYGIQVRGTLSLVALAKRRGLISQCRPVLKSLIDEGMYVSAALVDQVAQSVGE